MTRETKETINAYLLVISKRVSIARNQATLDHSNRIERWRSGSTETVEKHYAKDMKRTCKILKNKQQVALIQHEKRSSCHLMDLNFKKMQHLIRKTSTEWLDQKQTWEQ